MIFFFLLFRWFQPLNTFHTHSSLDLLSADLQHFMLLFSMSFSAKHTNTRNLKQGWGYAVVHVHKHMLSSCCVPLNGGHRSVKMRPQNLLTGDLLDHELPVTFQPAHQPVFLIVVAHRKKATCSQPLWSMIFILFFPSDKIEKKWNWHSRLGNESIATSQAVWLSKTHKCRASL